MGCTGGAICSNALADDGMASASVTDSWASAGRLSGPVTVDGHIIEVGQGLISCRLDGCGNVQDAVDSGTTLEQKESGNGKQLLLLMSSNGFGMHELQDSCAHKLDPGVVEMDQMHDEAGSTARLQLKRHASRLRLHSRLAWIQSRQAKPCSCQGQCMLPALLWCS